MTTRRTVFQPDLEVELPEDEEALLERDGLLLPVDEPAEKSSAKAGATVTAAAPAPSREASPDGGK